MRKLLSLIVVISNYSEIRIQNSFSFINYIFFVILCGLLIKVRVRVHVNTNSL